MKRLSTIWNICSIMLLGAWMASCSQDDSEDLGDTPFYQDYAVSISEEGVTAYAHFSKDKEDVLNSIKLDGEQSLWINGSELTEYGIDLNNTNTYPYHLDLGKGIKSVEFKFIRKKNMTLTNTVKTSDIKEFHLGEETTLDGNTEIAWIGEDQENTSISAMIEWEDGGVYSSQTLEVIGNIVKLGDLKGMLTVTRSKTINTIENDSPAGGKIVLSYFCTKEIK